MGLVFFSQENESRLGIIPVFQQRPSIDLHLPIFKKIWMNGQRFTDPKQFGDWPKQSNCFLKNTKRIIFSTYHYFIYVWYTLFFIRIYFIRISRLKFAKFKEYFKNKAKAEILKRVDIILCVETSVNTIQFYVFNLTV